MLVVRHCGDLVPKSWNRWGRPFQPDSRHLWVFPVPPNMDFSELLHSLVVETPPEVLGDCMAMWLSSNPDGWFSLDALDDLEPLTVLHARLKHPWIMGDLRPLLRTSFQAVVAIGAQPSLFGYHLVCRLHHPQTGLLGGRETYRLAYATRRSNTIDLNCQMCSLLAKAESIPRGMPVIINARPQSLLASDPWRHPSFHYLEQLQIDPSEVIIELSERCRSEEVEQLVARCETLRGMGFRIALGDLGVGAGQMRLLMGLRPELIRIDAGIFAEARDWPQARRMLRTLVEIAGDLGAQTLAGGVDRPEDLAFCQALSVDLVQGDCLGPCTTTPVAPSVPEAPPPAGHRISRPRLPITEDGALP